MRRVVRVSVVSLLTTLGSLVWAAGCKSLPEATTPTAPIVLNNGDEGDDEDGIDGVDGNDGPAPTSGAETAIPTKIRYVLVLIKENHTFDNYFTDFPGAARRSGRRSRSRIRSCTWSAGFAGASSR